MDERPYLEPAGALGEQCHAPLENLDRPAPDSLLSPRVGAELHPVEPVERRLFQPLAGDVPAVAAADGDQHHLLGEGRGTGVGHGDLKTQIVRSDLAALGQRGLRQEAKEERQKPHRMSSGSGGERPAAWRRLRSAAIRA